MRNWKLYGKLQMPNGDEIKSWIPLMVMLLGLAVTWGSLQTQVSAQEDRINKIEDTEGEKNRTRNTDRLKVAEVATRQEAIQDDVKEIKQKVEQILEKLDKSE